MSIIKANIEKLGMSEEVATLDIESLDTETSMVICSIGCVIRNLITGEVKATFYVLIDMEQPGRTRSKDTLFWWKEQEQESPYAYDQIFNNSYKRKSLYDALVDLNSFISENMEPRAKVFGNSDSFDNSAVKHAMKSFEIVPAWDHGCDQNLRTAVLMGRILLGFDPKKDLVFKGNKHCALDDALHESEYLYLIFKAFEEKLS